MARADEVAGANGGTDAGGSRAEGLAGRLAAVPLALAAVALFALMAMTFADVVLRSAFSAPLSAATELTRILVAVVVFAALPVVSWRGEHIAVDLLDGRFGPRAARVRDALVALLSGTLLWWPLERVLTLAERARDYGDVTEYLAIPQHLVSYGIAAGLALTMLVLWLRGVLLLLDSFPPARVDRPDRPAR